MYLKTRLTLGIVAASLSFFWAVVPVNQISVALCGASIAAILTIESILT